MSFPKPPFEEGQNDIGVFFQAFLQFRAGLGFGVSFLVLLKVENWRQKSASLSTGANVQSAQGSEGVHGGAGYDVAFLQEITDRISFPKSLTNVHKGHGEHAVRHGFRQEKQENLRRAHAIFLENQMNDLGTHHVNQRSQTKGLAERPLFEGSHQDHGGGQAGVLLVRGDQGHLVLLMVQRCRESNRRRRQPLRDEEDFGH